jgi:tetratricopeptide (TPR) repeat protein
MANFQKALSINPSLIDVFARVISLHIVKKEFDTALSKCNEQMKISEHSPKVKAIIQYLKGNVYLAKNSTGEAEESFQDALTLNPDFLRPYYSLAKIYLNTGNQEKAITQYKTLIEKQPEQELPHMMLGTIYEMQKKYDLSEHHYLEALKIKPGFAAAENNLAYLLASQNKDIDVALGYAQNAKEKLPGDPGVMDTIGLIYYKKQMYDKAIREFTESLEKLPENATVHFHLGLAYHKKGEKKLAEKELRKALELEDGFDGSDEAKRVLETLTPDK